jgi:hypothetical protein
LRVVAHRAARIRIASDEAAAIAGSRASRLGDARRVAVVEHQRVAVGIGEEGHLTDAGIERLTLEDDTPLL